MWSGKKAPDATPLEYAPTRTITSAISCNPGGAVTNNVSQDPDHQAPFTYHIARVQILSYSQPGDLVFDPFVGSGTTAITAARHGRSFVGGDLGARERDGARWADVARERAEAAAAEWTEKCVAGVATKED